MKVVWCKFKLTGFHKFDNAPAEVSYLSANHRHEFIFKVTIEVDHDNREIEFHTLKRFCMKELFARLPLVSDTIDEIQFGGMSCEMIAELLLRLLVANDTYNAPIRNVMPHDRQIIIDVSEDGECGALVSRL